MDTKAPIPCICGDVIRHQFSNCHQCQKPMHKRNFIYATKKTQCVIHHEVSICCECFHHHDHTLTKGSHSKKHFICQCGRDFCPDTSKAKCHNCQSYEYHLTLIDVSSMCIECSPKRIKLCHKCIDQNIKLKPKKYETCCGETICSEHLYKKCQSCDKLTHKLNDSSVRPECAECPNLKLCCECLNMIRPNTILFDRTKWSYRSTFNRVYRSYTCELCPQKTCYEHRRNKVEPKRCHEHQLFKSKKWRYGRPPVW